MKTTYDKIADALYITLKKGKLSRTKKLTDRLVVDIDKMGNVLGIEILDASTQIARERKVGKRVTLLNPKIPALA